MVNRLFSYVSVSQGSAATYAASGGDPALLVQRVYVCNFHIQVCCRLISKFIDILKSIPVLTFVSSVDVKNDQINIKT